MNIEQLEAIFNESSEDRVAFNREYNAAKIKYAEATAVARSDKGRLIAETEAWETDPEFISAAEHDARLPKNVGRTGTAIIAAAIAKRKGEIEKEYAFLDAGPSVDADAENEKLNAFRRSMNGGSL